MTENIVSKARLAALLGIERNVVSNWIARGKISKPALLADGRVDVALAVAQLTNRVDLIKSRGKSPGGLVAHAPAVGLATGLGYSQRITAARADLLQVELDRKALQRQVRAGRLMPAADYQRLARRSAARVVEAIEGAMVDWTALIRGAATTEEALGEVEVRLANIKKWVSKHDG